MQTTFPRLLLKHASERPHAPAMREKEYGIWQTITWADMAEMVQHMACGLHQSGPDTRRAFGGSPTAHREAETAKAHRG